MTATLFARADLQRGVLVLQPPHQLLRRRLRPRNQTLHDEAARVDGVTSRPVCVVGVRRFVGCAATCSSERRRCTFASSARRSATCDTESK